MSDTLKTQYLRKIQFGRQLRIPPTPGNQVIAMNRFNICSHIDQMYTEWRLHQIPSPTPRDSRLVEILEQVHDGTFVDILDSICPETAALALTQDQILTFVGREGNICVPSDGEGLFALFKHSTTYYVARFDRHHQQYRTFVYRFDDVRVWNHTPRGSLKPRRFLMPVLD